MEDTSYVRIHKGDRLLSAGELVPEIKIQVFLCVHGVSVIMGTATITRYSSTSQGTVVLCI